MPSKSCSSIARLTPERSNRRVLFDSVMVTKRPRKAFFFFLCLPFVETNEKQDGTCHVNRIDRPFFSVSLLFCFFFCLVLFVRIITSKRLSICKLDNRQSLNVIYTHTSVGMCNPSTKPAVAAAVVSTRTARG